METKYVRTERGYYIAVHPVTEVQWQFRSYGRMLIGLLRWQCQP